MKCRKKPVVVDAFQYDGDFMNRDGQYYVPAWAVDALNDGDFYYVLDGQLFVKTLEGDMHISAGDYVIQGVKGEIYPCKPDIFEQTYERVEG